jgi:hypothetical protein
MSFMIPYAECRGAAKTAKIFTNLTLKLGRRRQVLHSRAGSWPNPQISITNKTQRYGSVGILSIIYAECRK